MVEPAVGPPARQDPNKDRHHPDGDEEGLGGPSWLRCDKRAATSRLRIALTSRAGWSRGLT